MFKKLNALFQAQDMTVGRPMSVLLRFSIPLLIGNLAQQMYSTVDSVIVGRYIGDRALSAVGTTLPIINLLLVLFMAVATGAGIMVAQYYGAKDRVSLSRSIGNALTLIVISSLLIMAVGIPLTGTLLSLTNTPPETFEMARSYLTVILWGILLFGVYNIVSGILRGLGNSVFPLLTLLLTSGLNVVLDIWFVAGLGMGVAGAAWATLLSVAISAVLCIIKLFRMHDTVPIHAADFVLAKKYSANLLRLGLPAGITQAVFSLSMVLVQALANSMGYQVVTTSTAVMRIDGFAMMPNFTYGMAIATFVGQNIGANRMDRVEQGSKDMARLAICTALGLVAMLLLLSKYLMGMFTSTPEVVDLGVRAIRILAVGYVAVAVTQVFGGIMRGAGDTMPSMWISMLTVVVRVPVAYVWARLTASPENPAGAPEVVFLALLTSWVIGGVATYLWYRRGTWRGKSLVSPALEAVQPM